MSNNNSTTGLWINNNENLPALSSGESSFSNHQQSSTVDVSGKTDKTKRKQVKNACVNCQKACKKCDDGRPCNRCIKLGLTATCRNSDRKERKKGVKRGPYKKRQTSNKDKPVYPKLTDDWKFGSTLYNQLPISVPVLNHQTSWSPSVSPTSSSSYCDLEDDSYYLAAQTVSNSATQPSLSPTSSGFESEEALHYNYPLGYTNQGQAINASLSYSSSMLNHQPITGNVTTSVKPESYSWDVYPAKVNTVKCGTPIGCGPTTFPLQSMPQYTLEQYGEAPNTEFQKSLPESQYSQLQEINYMQSNATTFWSTPVYGQYPPYYYDTTAVEYN